MNPIDHFIAEWDGEAKKTTELLRSLPPNQYDFRPDAGGRSLGELAWHLAEIDAYVSFSLDRGRFEMSGEKPPGIERPKVVNQLSPGYERIHREATERVRKLKADDLSRKLIFFDGNEYTIGEILWGGLLRHQIHHRGQLSLMCRLAGGTPPGLYGPNRETIEAMKAKN